MDPHLWCTSGTDNNICMSLVIQHGLEFSNKLEMLGRCERISHCLIEKSSGSEFVTYMSSGVFVSTW